jgi:hypothetical protein
MREVVQNVILTLQQANRMSRPGIKGENTRQSIEADSFKIFSGCLIQGIMAQP